MILDLPKTLDNTQTSEEVAYWIQREHAVRKRVEDLNRIRTNMAKILTGIGVPEKWLLANFDGCGDLPADLVSDCQKFSELPEGILYLFGIPGCGKTWIATAILRHCLAQGILSPCNCRYVSERGFLDELRASFDEGEVSPRFLPAHHPNKVHLLIFDDLASTRLTDWGKGEIANLIETRHANDLPTIITSNISPDDLAEIVDGRIASRIAESRKMLMFPPRDLRVFKSESWQVAFDGDKIEDVSAKVIDFLKKTYQVHEQEIHNFFRTLSNEEIIDLIEKIPSPFQAPGQLTLSNVLESKFWKLRLWQAFAVKRERPIAAVVAKTGNKTTDTPDPAGIVKSVPSREAK
jgi:DNA replication protein DnaC